MALPAQPHPAPGGLLRRIAQRLTAPAHLVHAFTAQFLAEVALFLTPSSAALHLGAAAPLYVLSAVCWLASGFFAVMALVCAISLITGPAPNKAAVQFYVLTTAVGWATTCLTVGMARAGVELARLGRARPRRDA